MTKTAKKTIYGISTSIIANRGAKSNYRVRIRVSYGGDRVDLRPGITIENKDQWQDHRVKRGCKVGDVNFNIINRSLIKYEELVDYYFEQCEENSLEPSLNELRLWFNDEVSKIGESEEPTVLPRLQVAKKTFFEIYDDFVEDKKIRLQDAGFRATSIEPYLHLRQRLIDFDENLNLESLTRQKMIDFIRHLSFTMYNDSIDKYLTYLRSFVNWAESTGYTVNKEYRLYKPKLKKAKKAIRFLTVEEIDKLWYLQLDSVALEQTRDIFMVQIYTGLRYSDLKTLRKNNFVFDENEDVYINKETIKTGVYLDFRLPKRAKIIYEKYLRNIFPNDAAFPMLSNQKYNKHLRELGHIAGLQGQWRDIQYKLDKEEIVLSDKADLESHTARRTFVCMAYNVGMSSEQIAEITGHKNIGDLKPYKKASHQLTDSVIDAIDKIDRDKRMKVAVSNNTVA